MNKKLIVLGMIISALLTTNLVSAQRAKPIQLKIGKNIFVKGSVYEGNQADYVFIARKGQRLKVRLLGRDGEFDLHVIHGSDFDEALCEEADECTKTLPSTGKYVISVRSVRELCEFALQILIK
jgi:hypothetical protein